MAKKRSMINRTTSARALKACLSQLMDEALNHDFRYCALHMRVAILELEDFLESRATTGSFDELTN